MADGTGLDHLRMLTADEWGHLERSVDRFVTAWRDGDRPAIPDYLPAETRLRRPALVELVHTDLELRLKAGEAARVEEYFTHSRVLDRSRSGCRTDRRRVRTAEPVRAGPRDG